MNTQDITVHRNYTSVIVISKIIHNYFSFSFFLFLVACNTDPQEKLFTIHKGTSLGINFQNTIVTNDTLHALSFEYIYNGSGVGVGDFNLDGLPDLFFGGNQVSSKLYLNKGKLKFEDVTQKAGLTTHQWITGVSVVDINADGLPDIYLSVAGPLATGNMHNLLYIHQGLTNGIPTFKESAKMYGLADERYSTMAAFFDYDLDGDLDVYVVNNWLEKFNRNNLRPKRIQGEAESTDRLYRNNGDNTFTDVSKEAGILIEGYGLGITICDINQDSWPDVYVANDFMSNDLLWINQRDGTFTNRIGEYLKHQTHNGMGVDIADFNNDGLTDIIVVDMLPPGHIRQKLMTPGQNYDHFHMSLELGYQPQYMRNTLQLNRGKIDSDSNPLFSEIAFMAGVAQTDWSWAPLFADFDNDGWKDLFIANGYRKDVTDLDFIYFGLKNENPFGTQETRREKFKSDLELLPEVKLTNYIFKNNETLIFDDKTKDWGIDFPTFSNGAVYADLDNDGDLDLITNNIDQEVIIYENHVRTKKPDHHYLKLKSAEPTSAIQKVWVYANGKMQYMENTPYRGFQSTVENILHFGIGKHQIIDSLIILWPDTSAITLHNISPDTLIEFSKKYSKPFTYSPPNLSNATVEKTKLVAFKHTEKSASDLKVTRTLLHELSRYGPCLAVGDVNGDELDDFFIGGESSDPAQLFIQQLDNTFLSTPFPSSPEEEDGAACFFDANGDGYLDLYVAKTSPFGQTEAKPHRLYINDGKGNFSFLPEALPEITTSASCVEAADIDGDGQIDLFVGGRLKTGAYPYSPRSYILKNQNGRFIDVTANLNPTLVEPGMISAAVWADIDNDNFIDLVITGEWQPIRIFKNSGTKFIEITEQLGLQFTNGWWNCIRAADLNNDGYVDLVAGNNGTNSFFRASQNHPFQLIANDFDGNGSVDPIASYYNPIEKEHFMVHNRMVVIDQIPGLKRRFETFKKFASTPMPKVFTKSELRNSRSVNAYIFSSVLLQNQQGKKFRIEELPEIIQISTLNDLLIDDINNDGHFDIITIGNNYEQETLFGNYTASLGTILLGDGKFGWTIPSPQRTKFIVDGNSRNIQLLRHRLGKVYMVTQNNDSLLFFKSR